MGVKVLSLFDGMACGMLAMQKAGIEVDEYNAYEIDKYAIKTATHNFPMIKEHGDVFSADFTQYKNIDLVVCGSYFWLERHEYDGAEWWEYKELPVKPLDEGEVDIWENCYGGKL